MPGDQIPLLQLPPAKETPNLWIKAKFKLRQFSVRGLKKVGIESLWVCLAYTVCQWIRRLAQP
jgi:hypothetical protein